MTVQLRRLWRRALPWRIGSSKTQFLRSRACNAVNSKRSDGESRLFLTGSKSMMQPWRSENAKSAGELEILNEDKLKYWWARFDKVILFAGAGDGAGESADVVSTGIEGDGAGTPFLRKENLGLGAEDINASIESSKIFTCWRQCKH